METKHDHRTSPPRRPRFAPRQQLTALQLNGIQDEELWRSRLLNRAMYGYGVVFGYQLGLKKAPTGERATSVQHEIVTQYSAPGVHVEHREEAPPARPPAEHPHNEEIDLKNHCIHLSCGLILDRHGREVFWPGGRLCVGDIVGGLCVDHVDGERRTREGWYLLHAHYAEQKEPPDGCDPCVSDALQWTRQSVVFTLQWKGKEEDACKDLEHPCPDAECATLLDYVCGRTGSERGRIPPAPDLEWACREPGELCDTRCDTWAYDPQAGVPIACVKVCRITPQECEPDYGFCPDKPKVCSVRPFVYRNPLLFELARECHIDLARVERLSTPWQDWIIRDWEPAIGWGKFRKLFDQKDAFRIWFNNPIVARTLHEASVFLSAVTQEDDSDYWRVRRIPMKVEALDGRDNVVNGTTLARSVRLIPDEAWVGQMGSRNASLRHGGLIELTIRGQIVRDRCGRMLDAQPIPREQHEAPDLFFLDPKWSGQARPGDDFLAVFRFGPREGHQG